VKVLHLYGGATSSTPLPEFPAGAEKWGINNLWCKYNLKERYEGWTRWFDLHPDAHVQGRKHNMYPWLCQQTKPIVRFWPDPNMNTQLYPHEAVRAKFGGTRFFCSSFDWLMALAIYEGFERVDLYGWRMAQLNYVHQVKSGQFWIRKAVEAGVEIVNHSKSSLFIVKHTVVEPDMSKWKMYGLETCKRGECYSHRWA